MLNVSFIRTCSLRRVLGLCNLITSQSLNGHQNLTPVAAAAYLHLSHAIGVKIFVDHENRHAHSVLEQSLKPYQIFRLDDKTTTTEATACEKAFEQLEVPQLVLYPNGRDVTIDELLHAFAVLTRYCKHTNTCISDERFAAFCQLFCEHSHQLNDEQLFSTLRQLAQLPEEATPRAPNFRELWNSLDIVCCRRVDRWNTNELLLACDAWYALRLARVSDFIWEALCKVGRKIKRLQPTQVVQALFYCNLLRRPLYDMIDFEFNIIRHMEAMSLQELGVMSMGFFKTQTALHSQELVEHLYKRLIAELDTVDDITLVAITKVIRYSNKLPQIPLMMELMEGLQPQVSRLSLVSCLHLALFGVELQCCDDGLLELVLQRFNREINEARLKDMERICLAIGVFNYRSETGVVDELCAKILTLLEGKIDEIMQHPRAFVCCLHYLAVRGYYNDELLSSVLDKRFIDHAYGKNMKLGREIFNLDSFVKINLRGLLAEEEGQSAERYAGNQLPDKLRGRMGKILTHYIPERNTRFRLSATDRILLEIKEAFEHILRPCAFKHILPHFERPDVIICYDNVQRKAVPLATDCPEDYSGHILTRKLLLGDAERAEVDTVVVVVAGWNNVVRDKNRFTGLFELKLQQLRLLGHKPIVIYWHEWRTQETPIDRQQLLKRKITNVINF